MNEIDILEQQAVEAAVRSDWKSAAKINKQILAKDKSNIAALLRMGFSNLQLRDYEEAQKYYRKALRIQPANLVASENLERLKILSSRPMKKLKHGETKTLVIDPSLFLEVSGKTKTVALVNLGQKNVLAHLETGEEVSLIVKRRKVEIRTTRNEYVGTLPDDLSRRLLLFLKAKSVYRSFIKEANINRIIVFIKEVKKGNSVKTYLSFPSNIQQNINAINLEQSENASDEDNEEFSSHDLEKLAETLTSEDKEYLPYSAEESDDDESEE